MLSWRSAAKGAARAMSVRITERGKECVVGSNNRLIKQPVRVEDSDWSYLDGSASDRYGGDMRTYISIIYCAHTVVWSK